MDFLFLSDLFSSFLHSHCCFRKASFAITTPERKSSGHASAAMLNKTA
jgi:hypothetical protein